MQYRHFHPLYTLKYINYGLVLCLLPLVRAVLDFNWQQFLVALQQDAFILIVMALLAGVLWYFSGFEITDSSVVLHQGLFFRSNVTLSRDMIAAVECVRPLTYRILGGTQVIIYFKSAFPLKKITLHFFTKDAIQAADTLLPVKNMPTVFEPTGATRLVFVMLSANVVTSCVFAVYSIKRISKILGTQVEEYALHGITELSHFLELFIPAGISMLATFVLLITVLTLMLSLLRTAGFVVGRGGGIILTKGGFITKIERRVSAVCVNFCDVRLTPFARVLRYTPVYITAGGYRSDTPLFVCRMGQEAMLQRLLADFTMPTHKMCVVRKKSLPVYIWLPASLCALLIALICVAANINMIGMIPVLSLLLLFALCNLGIEIEAFIKEGFCKNDNRTFSICYGRIFTRHTVCIFSHDISFTIQQSPIAAKDGRCNLYINTPARVRLRARDAIPHRVKTVSFNL
ncbi:MAG: PH domain-containing protein [Oscillospiraceae bacterium]|nr:PH domain-containing protein [Oscillospiraceae bacterium]